MEAMTIKRFNGRDIGEALRLAQEALGPEAVILQTRRVPAHGLARLVGRPRVEVLAALDPPAPSLSPSRADGRSEYRGVPANPALVPPIVANRDLIGIGSDREIRQNPAERSNDNRTEQRISVSPGDAGWQTEIASLRQEMARLRRQLEVSRWGSPRHGLSETGDGPSLEEMAGRLLSGVVTRTIEIREGACTAVAVVGPTGVGKTTTIAKLAAVASKIERRRVAFISVDTYRIGAVEQLQTYANLLDIPLSVAYSAEDVRAARDRYEAYDLVFVDTVGRSPRNSPQLAELSELLDVARPDEVHLALDTRGSYATHGSVLQGFAALRPTQLLLSKLDETPRLEDSLAAALEGGLPVSYLTTGQRVPEDLAPADRTQLAGWLLGGQ